MLAGTLIGITLCFAYTYFTQPSPHSVPCWTSLASERTLLPGFGVRHLEQDECYGVVELGPGDRIITDGHKLSTEYLLLSHADPGSISPK
jgi:hypothetical protein